ncbi:MAG: 30S ribosomal protein S9 [Deltaproteobacteria bacterium]|nr:30S ribosomal protein S9 [Deltaproteobacteria bacterium]
MAQVYHAIGKRKSAVARVYVNNGSGAISVNEKSYKDYFADHYQAVVRKPLEILKADSKYDISVSVKGGGVSAQASAVMHGIAKCLTLISDSNRPTLKKAHMLTRDSRVVERKKYGHKKARKSFQFSKR